MRSPQAWRPALSDKTTAGTPVSSPPQNGFDVDVGEPVAGNTITVNYTDTATSTPHTITLVRVDDPSALPLANTATATANDTVFGIDFSGGMGSVIAQINTALTGTGMVASNPSGTTLEVLDDGARQHRRRQFAFDESDDHLFDRRQRRISAIYRRLYALYRRDHRYRFGELGAWRPVLRLILQSSADPSSLVVYQAGTPAGDSTRPDFILQQLTQRVADIFAEHRNWNSHRAVYRVAHDLSAAGHQPAR